MSTRERPILFSAPMVRAILEGRKTQTRRVYKPRVQDNVMDQHGPLWSLPCPYGVPGDRLWVRETWYERYDGLDDTYCEGYAADGEMKCGPVSATAHEAINMGARSKRPSIFLCRADSRITLEITDIRVQRVQEISEEDAKAEGVSADACFATARLSYEQLWDSINAKRGYGWEANPWVWALTFRVIP
jgi:hypothetical protein